MYYFIINPNSRSGQGAATWNITEKELKLRKVKYKAFFTRYVGHAKKLSAKISSEHPQSCIIAIGGDGTINEVLNGIQDLSQVSFGCIPTGSGNDFARSMGISRNPVKALHGILEDSQGVFADVGYLKVHGKKKRFGVSCGIGFDAAICHDALSSPVKKVLNRIGLGKLTYILIAVKQFLLCTPSEMDLTLDGGRSYHFSRVYYTAVMNQPYEGGGIPMCPDASFRDHALDLCVVADISKLRFLLVLIAAVFGRHSHLKGVYLLHCSHVHLTGNISLAVHRDGESNGLQTGFFAGIEEKPLKVLGAML